MLKCIIFSLLVVSALVVLGFGTADAQQNLAQQAYGIFEQNCLNCHGEHGAFTEEIIIERTALIETGAVVPKRPGASALYQRLIEKRVEKRMPLGQPPLSPAAIDTIRRWIQAGAPNWADTTESDSPFITAKEMLETIEKHVNSLAPFDRTYARYFTMTHLYNAGERAEALHAYQRALSKLVNSLSWGREVTIPRAIDPEETIFYIDLRDYEWEIGTNRWTLMEAEYPYRVEFNAPAETSLREKLTNLREEMDCEVPFVHVDWFLSTASLPPLYHDILDLPATDRELEDRLEVNVVENLRNAAGKRVWRAGFNDSGVSNNNRVVERHASRYGAYWKSYDFAGSVDTQYIFTHPLSFTHDGGEVVFNLPNGLQAYYLADAGGRRLDAAPIDIVSNPAASDPTVRNGLSCIGCHTEGMKTFEDQVRGVVEKNPNPPYDKARALSLYVDKATMDGFIGVDTNRYRQSLEAAGGIFGGIEPIQRFHEAFHAPLDIAHAAAAVGLETRTFLARVRQNTSLQNLGLLVLENGSIKRDTWTSKFSDIMFALDFPEKSVSTPVVNQEERIPGEAVYIPDANLRAAIAESLGKNANAPITVEDMEGLRRFSTMDREIRDLTGLQFATNLTHIDLRSNVISDLSPLAGLTNLELLWFADNDVSDLSPLQGLINLKLLHFSSNPISDLSPLTSLTKLEDLAFHELDLISDISLLTNFTKLRVIRIWNSPISDLSPLAKLAQLELVDICGSKVSDISPLAELRGLTELYLFSNDISDVSPLAGLANLTRLDLSDNNISDISPLAKLNNLEWLRLDRNEISDFSSVEELGEQIKLIWYGNSAFPKGGPKIEGPWLWAVLPDRKLNRWDLLKRDLLSETSGGQVTEAEIAARGATEGRSIGNSVWTSHKLPPTGRIEDMLGDPIPDGVIYGSVLLYSPREQATTIYVGSFRELKVWLNGTLIHEHERYARFGTDYTDFYPVTLQQGKNVLLVALSGDSGDMGFFGFEAGTEYTVSNYGVGYTFSKPTIHVGDTFTLDLSAENVSDLAGWQFDIAFDPAGLEAIEVNEGNFLKTGGGATFFQKGVINNRSGKITGLSSARLSKDGASGTGTLLSVTLAAKTAGQTQLRLENFQLAAITGAPIAAGPHEVGITIEGQLAIGDVNRDGQVSILDLVLVARHFGETVPANSEVDINGDGLINIIDLILVAQHMGGSTAAAPSILAVDGIEGLDPVMIQAWIERAQLEDDGSIVFQQGIAKLQSLLASMIPEETVLLANYPNPFNPETWIPYQLANPSEVLITIYNTRGSVIRQLDLGHQREGYYTSRGRAAYWDGRNDVGERVASGVYFYQLQTDYLSLLRKMVILK